MKDLCLCLNEHDVLLSNSYYIFYSYNFEGLTLLDTEVGSIRPEVTK